MGSTGGSSVARLLKLYNLHLFWRLRFWDAAGHGELTPAAPAPEEARAEFTPCRKGLLMSANWTPASATDAKPKSRTLRARGIALEQRHVLLDT